MSLIQARVQLKRTFHSFDRLRRALDPNQHTASEGLSLHTEGNSDLRSETNSLTTMTWNEEDRQPRQICLAELVPQPPKGGQQSLQPEGNLDLRSEAIVKDDLSMIDVPPSDALFASLEQATARLLTANWAGLNVDFEIMEWDHPVIAYALSSTPTTQCFAPKLHIFTDGSYKDDTAAWAFVIICEFGEGPWKQFAKLAYAAGRLEDSPTSCACNSMNAEATAILAMTEFALSLPQIEQTSIHLHFDCTCAGFGALGQQALPTNAGILEERQLDARILMSLLQRKAASIRGIHVHSHQGNPFNELADSYASIVRQGWDPPNQAHWRSTSLLTHPLKQWAWMNIAPNAELPSLRHALKGTFAATGESWPDATLQPRPSMPTETATVYDIPSMWALCVRVQILTHPSIKPMNLCINFST